MNIQILDIINVLTTPLAGVIGWLVGRKKQKNDFLKDLQDSINLLSEENKKLMKEVIGLRKENIALRTEVEELIRKLGGVKTITKKTKIDETN